MIFYQHPTPASPQCSSVNEWNLRSERSAQFPGVSTKPLWKNRQLHSITVELGEWRIITDPIESAREFREEKCNYLRWKGARHCLNLLLPKYVWESLMTAGSWDMARVDWAWKLKEKQKQTIFFLLDSGNICWYFRNLCDTCLELWPSVELKQSEERCSSKMKTNI